MYLTDFGVGFPSLYSDLSLKNEAFSTEILQNPETIKSKKQHGGNLMKHIKKMIALFLAMVMAMSFAVTAMAAEPDSEIPENAICHTIELTVAPGETITGGDDSGVAPFIWNQIGHTVSGNKTYTQQFNVPERYIAYEMKATNSSGNAINASYQVDLLLASNFVAKATNTQRVDGVTYKMDHIDLSNTNERCLFCITNYAGVPISVTITYYSWA